MGTSRFIKVNQIFLSRVTRFVFVYFTLDFSWENFSDKNMWERAGHF